MIQFKLFKTNGSSDESMISIWDKFKIEKMHDFCQPTVVFFYNMLKCLQIVMLPKHADHKFFEFCVKFHSCRISLIS